jgi:tetratricopeptide (TPR) repeat protein
MTLAVPGGGAGRYGGPGGDVLFRHWLLIATLLLPAGLSRAADPAADQDQAMALLRDGKRQEALRAFDAIIASQPPDPSQALFVASLIDLEDGHWQAAKPYVQQLVKLRPSSFQAWELMIQVDQAAGDLEDRDASIQSLYESWRGALDPQIRSRVSFARDRIAGTRHTLVAQETLDPGGDDILRFLFQPQEEEEKTRHLIVVRSDDETNQRWRENGTVPYGTVVYHLDTVERLADGRSAVRPYEYYLDAPDYDRVRAKVVEILAGTAQPLTGQADPFWTADAAR